MLDTLKANLNPDHLRENGQQAVDEAKRHVHRVRGDLRRLRGRGRVRLWSIGSDTLSRAADVLDKAPGGLDPVVGPLRHAVDEQLEKLTSPNVENYDALNARKAASAVHDMDRVQLERVARYERAHKNRKTVLDAVKRRRERLERSSR